SSSQHVYTTYPFYSCDPMPFFSCYFFFFQAEDGIRDRNVTGVQTCALPISAASCARRASGDGNQPAPARSARSAARAPTCPPSRSEERRVGKECRSRRRLYYITGKR